MFNALLVTSDADVVSTLSYLLKNRRIHTGHQNSECIKRVIFFGQSCEIIAAWSNSSSLMTNSFLPAGGAGTLLKLLFATSTPGVTGLLLLLLLKRLL